jgi:hypothetical protein
MLADRPDGRRLNADEQRQLADLERRLLSAPLAPPRPVPVGLAAVTRPPALDRPVLVAAVVVAGALLVLATVIGGPGGLAAVTVTLLATLLVWQLRDSRFALRRPRRAR